MLITTKLKALLVLLIVVLPGQLLFLPPAYPADAAHPPDKPEVIEQRLLASAIRQMYKDVGPGDAAQIVNEVYSQSRQQGINPLTMLGIIAVESGFKRKAISPDGSMGYTQVNVKAHRRRIGSRDILATSVNIEVGVAIYAECVQRFGNTVRALGCYNGTKDPAKYHRYAEKVRAKNGEIFKVALAQAAQLQHTPIGEGVKNE